HPLGNFTVNRYSRLEPDNGRLRVRYVLDMAEIPTFQEMANIDRDRDGRVSEAESRAYAEGKAAEMAANLRLSVNGAPVPLSVTESALTFPPGQGGLTTLRLALWLEARVAAGGAYTVDYRDDNYADRLGWKEILVRAGSGVALADASVPSVDQSREL